MAITGVNNLDVMYGASTCWYENSAVNDIANDIRRLWLAYSRGIKVRDYVANMPDAVCDRYRNTDLATGTARSPEYSGAALGLWRGVIYAAIYAVEQLDRIEYMSDIAAIVALVNSGEMATVELREFRKKLYLELVAHLSGAKFGSNEPTTYRGYSTYSVIKALAKRKPDEVGGAVCTLNAMQHVQACSLDAPGPEASYIVTVETGDHETTCKLQLPPIEIVLEYIARDYSFNGRIREVVSSVASAERSDDLRFTL